MSSSRPPAARDAAAAILLAAVVIVLSLTSVSLWGVGKRETTKRAAPISYEPDMSVGRFAEINGIARPTLKKILGLQSRDDLARPLRAFAVTKEELLRELGKDEALRHEEENKNWVKIPVKFALWLAMLAVMFVMLSRRAVTARRRRLLYGTAVFMFGVVLGADPSPMGPIKDTVALYGARGIVFKPRIAALGVFLGSILVCGKLICGWGCQFGAMQDLVFRLGAGRAPRVPRKPPFALANGVRAAFFAVFCLMALGLGHDIIEPIDPFKLYKPAGLSLTGAAFLAGILAAAFFIYRPWCHFLCPFGLAGWLAERAALARIRVDKRTCTGCRACARACPSTAMDGLLDGQKLPPDCYACGACLESCPNGAVYYGASKPRKEIKRHPPAGPSQ